MKKLLTFIPLLFLSPQGITETERGKILEIPDLVIKQIKHWEGLRLNTYENPGDPYYYVGYGHQVEKEMTISYEKAESFLRKDLHQNLSIIERRSFLDGVELTRNKKLALAMFSFNVGVGRLFDSSIWNSLIRKENPRVWLDYHKFPHANGELRRKIEYNFIQRRAFEYLLFLNKVKLN